MSDTTPYDGDIDTGTTRLKVIDGALNTTDYHYQSALGSKSKVTTWNKFGYNADVDVGTEVIAEFGGTFTPLTTASTLRFVSTSTDDDGDPAGTGANSLIVWGVDANRAPQLEIVTLDGTSNVDTTTTWLGINRVSIYLAGSGLTNAGKITVTAVTGGSVQATIPAGEGTTQQMIFFVPASHQFLVDWLFMNTLKQAAQNPVVTYKAWVFSAVANAKYEVFRKSIDTAVENTTELNPSQPFVVGEKSVLWFEATTDKADTIVNGRFSGILVQD